MKPLLEGELRPALPAGERGMEIHIFQEIDSTNNEAKRRLGADCKLPALFLAERQSAGRGRQGRQFYSPADAGLYMSLALKRPERAESAVSVTTMAAVAVCNAVEQVSGLRPGIKWTNDLVLSGKKLCGILTEMSVEGETGMAESLVIGAGVNVNQSREDFGPEVAEIATSLTMEGYQVSRPALAAAMIGEFSRLSDSLGGNDAQWVDAYRRDCVTLGKPVKLLWTDHQTEAVALDVDDQFGLVVRFPNGAETTVRTGEVSVRGMYGYVD